MVRVNGEKSHLIKPFQLFAIFEHLKKERFSPAPEIKLSESNFYFKENKGTMKNYLLKTCLVFMALFTVLTFSQTGDAQVRRNRQRVSKQQVEDLLKRIEERSDKFTNALNKSLDRSRLDGSRSEDNIVVIARRLENATDELRREFDHHDSHAENAAEVRKVINSARAVNRIMTRRSFSRQAENSWVNLRSEINALAALYRIGAI
jgi:hypothetical protein